MVPVNPGTCKHRGEGSERRSSGRVRAQVRGQFCLFLEGQRSLARLVTLVWLRLGLRVSRLVKDMSSVHLDQYQDDHYKMQWKACDLDNVFEEGLTI